MNASADMDVEADLLEIQRLAQSVMGDAPMYA